MLGGESPVTEEETSDMELEGGVDLAGEWKSTKAPSQRRGRPCKPNPVIDMSASRFIAANKKLVMKVEDGENVISFDTNAPRETKAGKVGWTFSHKAAMDVDGVSVTFQLTGNIYGIRSEKWAR